MGWSWELKTWRDWYQRLKESAVLFFYANTFKQDIRTSNYCCSGFPQDYGSADCKLGLRLSNFKSRNTDLGPVFFSQFQYRCSWIHCRPGKKWIGILTLIGLVCKDPALYFVGLKEEVCDVTWSSSTVPQDLQLAHVLEPISQTGVDILKTKGARTVLSSHVTEEPLCINISGGCFYHLLAFYQLSYC